MTAPGNEHQEGRWLVSRLAGRARRRQGDQRRRRPNGWNLAVAAVAAGVFGTTALAPAGASSVPGPGPFGLTPEPTATGQLRPYFELTVPPGGSARDIVIISNEGTKTERLRVGTSPGITAANSGSAFGGLSGSCAGVGCWVTGLPAIVTLPPGTGRALAFRVAVPAGTRPAQYLAGITATFATPPRPISLGSRGKVSVHVVVVDQVTVGVAITVGSRALLRTALVVPAVTAGSIGSLPRLYVHVRNTGQTFVKANGTLSCRVGGQDRSFRVVVDTVLPGDSAVLPVNAPGLSGGAVPCTVRLEDSAGRTVTWSGIVSVSAPAPAATIHTGSGAYSTLPESPGIPGWAIALMVIGALVLAGLVRVMLLYRKHGR
jgi:hypothetical protein